MQFYAALTVSFLIFVVNGEQKTYSFTLTNACGLENRNASGCSLLLSGDFSSWISCAAVCRYGCLGVKWIPDRKCHLHVPCATTIPTPYCNSSTDVYIVFQKSTPCQNEGVWDWNNETCQCVGGFVGQLCERYAESCAELAAHGYQGSGVFTLQLSETLGPFRTKCNIGSLTKQYTFIMQNAGLQSNNKTWSDYVNGFYTDQKHFWIGFNNFKAIIDGGHTTMRLDSNVMWSNGDPIVVYGYSFMNFTLQGDSSGFSMTYLSSLKDNASAVYGNCLLSVNGSSFSTWNVDNDSDPARNTASMLGAGWWFKSYDVGCNPMGVRGKWTMDGLNLDSSYYATTVLYFKN